MLNDLDYHIAKLPKEVREKLMHPDTKSLQKKVANDNPKKIDKLKQMIKNIFVRNDETVD